MMAKVKETFLPSQNLVLYVAKTVGPSSEFGTSPALHKRNVVCEMY